MGRGFAWLRRAGLSLALAGSAGAAVAVLALPVSTAKTGSAPTAELPYPSLNCHESINPDGVDVGCTK